HRSHDAGNARPGSTRRIRRRGAPTCALAGVTRAKGVCIAQEQVIVRDRADRQNPVVDISFDVSVLIRLSAPWFESGDIQDLYKAHSLGQRYWQSAPGGNVIVGEC